MNKQNEKNKWIGIRLIGKDGINADALGSKVFVKVNEQVLTREVDSGSGHGSQSSKTLYFGLGRNLSKVNMVIRWIGGKETRLDNLKSNHVYTIDSDGNINRIY